jgi:type IV pilus assembly protein PilA
MIEKIISREVDLKFTDEDEIMKTKRKTSGFFIVEILIVLVIVGILTIALLPNFMTYTKRAKFVDVVNAVAAVKSSVEACALNLGAVTNCLGGTNGVLPDSGVVGNYVATVTTGASGVITGTGTSAVDSATYILTPTYSAGVVTWAASGTCSTLGLC